MAQGYWGAWVIAKDLPSGINASSAKGACLINGFEQRKVGQTAAREQIQGLLDPLWSQPPVRIRDQQTTCQV